MADGDTELLQSTLEQIKGLGAKAGFNLDYCEHTEGAISDLLCWQHRYQLKLDVDRSTGEPLGVTFSADMGVESVSPGTQGMRLGMSNLKDWALQAIDGVPVRTTTALLQIYSSKRGKITLTFARKTKTIEVKRQYDDQGIGMKLSGILIIDSVREGSPAASAGLGEYIGCKVAAIDDRLILEPQDLVNRTHDKRSFKLSIVKMHSVKKLNLSRSDPNEKLGVSFGGDLSITSVQPNSLGARIGFGDCLFRWKITAINDVSTGNTEELVGHVAGKKKCTFLLVPVAQQVAAAKKPLSRNTRECVITRREGSESIGMFCNDALVLELVTERSASDKAGLRDLIGWRVVQIDGAAVVDKEDLKKQISEKVSLTATLVLDDDNLPSSVVQVDLMELKTPKEMLNAFGRFGAVSQILPVEKVSYVPCEHCGEDMALSMRFCSACGGRVTTVTSPYFCHVTYRRVSDAKRALADPPISLPGFVKLSFYHPPQTGSNVVEEDEDEERAKPSDLSMAKCLGFFNAYFLLGVPRDATKEEIKSAYKEKSRRYHPDRRHLQGDDMKDDNGEMFKAVAKANKILVDKEERKSLDKDIDKAITMYGKKQVLSRIPSRGGKKRETRIEEEPQQRVAPSVFGGYHTGDGQKSRLGFKDTPRGFKGLRSVEVIPSKVRAPDYDDWDHENDSYDPNYQEYEQPSYDFDQEYDISCQGKQSYDTYGNGSIDPDQAPLYPAAKDDDTRKRHRESSEDSQSKKSRGPDV